MRAREFITEISDTESYLFRQQWQNFTDENIAKHIIAEWIKNSPDLADYIRKYDAGPLANKILKTLIQHSRKIDPSIDVQSEDFKTQVAEPFVYQLKRHINQKYKNLRWRQQELWPELEKPAAEPVKQTTKPEPEESIADLVRQKAEQEKQQAVKKAIADLVGLKAEHEKLQAARKAEQEKQQAVKKAEQEKEWQQRLEQARQDAEKPDEFDVDLAKGILDDIKDELGERYDSVVARIEQELETAGVVPDSMTSREAADNILISTEDSLWFTMVFGRRPNPLLALIAVRRAPEVINEIDEDLRTPTLWLTATRARPDNMTFVASIKPESLRNEIIKSLGLEEKWQEHQQWLQRRRGRLN